MFPYSHVQEVVNFEGPSFVIVKNFGLKLMSCQQCIKVRIGGFAEG